MSVGIDGSKDGHLSGAPPWPLDFSFLVYMGDSD